jgi:hypothetical protein
MTNMTNANFPAPVAYALSNRRDNRIAIGVVGSANDGNERPGLAGRKAFSSNPDRAANELALDYSTV